jgi:hypothetical protein
MYKYLTIVVLFFLSSCGTTGHIAFYDFNASKFDVEKEIKNVIYKDSAYVVPNKWKSHTEGDYFERIYIYFRNAPEEIYQIGFVYDSTAWKQSSSCRLGFVSIFKGQQFQYESDLSNKEIERIMKRLETNILSKIKYKYFKSD